MRFFALLLLFCAPAAAQGINPISPNGNDLIQVIPPSQANPSNNYTTPARIEAGGPAPTLSGNCAVVATTQAGGGRTGKFTIPAGDCAAGTTVTLTMAVGAPTGFVCDAHNLNTPTSIIDQTAVAASSVTFTIRTVNSSAGDVVLFKCQGY
jgi:hypothetical protein